MKEALRKKLKVVWKHRHRDTLMLAGASGALIFGLIQSIVTGDGTWFSRSASISTLLSAFSQYNMSADVLQGHAHAMMVGAVTRAPIAPSTPLFKQRLSAYSIFLICLATAIWGYGDLIPFPKR